MSILHSRCAGVLISAGVGLSAACSDSGAGPGNPGGGGAGSSGVAGSGSGNSGNVNSGAGPSILGAITPSGNPPPSLGELAEAPVGSVPWTILVYGHGDHNLSYSLLVDLQEMMGAELGTAIQLVVLTDWDSSQVIAETDPPQTYPDGLQLFRVPGGGADLELLAEGGEANLDDPTILGGIVRDVFAAFPAQRRGLILWDHGGAWEGGFGSDSQNGTLQGARMGAEVAAATIASGLAAAGITEDPPLEFLSFDTCLMAGAEIAYPFRDLAAVYLADAEIDYGPGWNYRQTLSHFAANANAPMAELAVAEVGFWDEHHATASPNDTLLRSHVALDLTGMDAFAASASELTRSLIESPSFDPIELGRSSFFSLAPYFSQFENAGSQSPGLRDIGQLLSFLGGSTSDPAVAQAARNARQVLDQLVLARSQGALREAGAQAGLHVEQTLGSLLTQERLDQYGGLASAWVGASQWDQILLLAALNADAEPPVFEHAVVNAEAASRLAPPTLQLLTQDPTAAKAEVYVAANAGPNTIVLLGLVGTGLIGAGDVHEFAWNGSVVSFADGQVGMLDVWLDVGDNVGEPVLMIPGALDGVGEEPLVTYLVFGASESVASVAVVAVGEVMSTLGTAEIASAFPGATFTPINAGIDLTTGGSSLLLGNPMPIPEAGFPLTAQYLPAGSYALFTTVTDVWGSEATDFDVLTLTEPLGQ